MTNTEQLLPNFAKTIVVPVSRPETAAHMLELAVSLIHPQEGRVIAVIVVEEDKTETNERLQSIEPVCEVFTSHGHNVELKTQIAGTITRGILDATREYGADMLIIGAHKTERRQVKLGSIVENVIQAAVCDVLIYRLGDTPEYRRVVVPVRSTTDNMIALTTAAILAKTHEVPLLPLVVYRDYVYRSDYQDIMRGVQHYMGDLMAGNEAILGQDPATRVLQRVDAGDLLVLGFSQKTDFERQIEYDISNVLLNRAPGPVLLISRLQYRTRMQEVVQRRLQRFNPMLTEVERNEIVWRAQQTSLANIDYIVMILFSAGLASMGLLVNSAAVIIGAMLVAPLMQPLAAVSTGLVTGLLPITRRAALTLLEGVILALLISWIAGSILPLNVPTPEMLARGNPSLFDAGVAIVSGFVAAYATARKEIPAALAGVAIAAALMPPVCTIGLGFAMGRVDLALGASLLFFTNINFIVLSQAIIFLWIGMRPGRRQESIAQTRLWWGLLAIGAVVVASILFALTQRAMTEQQIARFFQNQFGQDDVVSIDVDLATDELDIVLTLRTEEAITPARVQTLTDDLAAQIDRNAAEINLQVAFMQLVSPQLDRAASARSYLAEVLPGIQIREVRVYEDVQAGSGALAVDLTLASDDSTLDINALEAGLSEQFGRQVRLTVYTPATSPDIPEATPETTPEAETSDAARN